MLDCFNPILGQIWTNPNVGLKNAINKFNPTAGFVHIWPKIGLKQSSIFRVYKWINVQCVMDAEPGYYHCIITMTGIAFKKYIMFTWSCIIRLTSAQSAHDVHSVTPLFSLLHKHHTSVLIWGGVCGRHQA